jgi:hypothetical protein
MQIVNFVKSEHGAKIRESLLQDDFEIFELNSVGIVAIEEFYGALIRTLPIGIPLSGKVHWDAFLDSAWEGITERANRKTALIWLGSESILEAKLSDFATIINVFYQLAEALYSGDEPHRFNVFALGDSENYS